MVLNVKSIGVQTIRRILDANVAGVVTVACLIASMSVIAPSRAEEIGALSISYSGPLELTLSRPPGSYLSYACPLEKPISVHMNANLGAAKREVSSDIFQKSVVELNGTVVNLSLLARDFEFSGPVPLSYSGTSAEGQFVFWDSESELTCFGQVTLIPTVGRPAQRSAENETPAIASTNDISGTQTVSGPSVWTGQAVPKDIVKNYGEFCDVRMPSKLTLEIDEGKVSGQLVRAADRKITVFHGKLRGNIVTGQLADTNSFMSKFILTGRLVENAITGSLATTAWNSCTATFTVVTDDPRYQDGGA